MTKYSDLSTADKDALDIIFADDSEWHKDRSQQQKDNTINCIKKDEYCTECWCSHYTCLCSHEN